jgi:HPt (histidine-containing phosphotransfer) domain-containing protein
MMNTDEHITTSIAATAEDLYDLSMLEEMDDNEYLLEVLTILLNETPKDLKQMKEALRAGKALIVCQAAHKLKSSSGIIQAEKFTALLTDIEVLGKSGVVNNALISVVENAAHQYSFIEKSLKMHIAGLK